MWVEETFQNCDISIICQKISISISMLISISIICQKISKIFIIVKKISNYSKGVSECYVGGGGAHTGWSDGGYRLHCTYFDANILMQIF